MFTGIVTHLGRITKITDSELDLEILTTSDIPNVKLGSSIAINGICLTLISQFENMLQFNISQETIDKTNIQYAKIEDVVNIEFSLKIGDEIAGHFVYGHVDFIARIKKIKHEKEFFIFQFDLLRDLSKFIAKKGSVSINGISLTVNNVDEQSFDVTIIPHTIKSTNLQYLYENDFVNIEIDIFARYLEKFQRI